MKKTIYRVGILNSVNGKIVKEKRIVDDTVYTYEQENLINRVVDIAEKVSRWFDGKDTFFSGRKIWECWNNGLAMIEERVRSLVSRKLLTNIVCETVSVFPEDGGHGVEHEFFVEKVEGGA